MSSQKRTIRIGSYGSNAGLREFIENSSTQATQTSASRKYPLISPKNTNILNATASSTAADSSSLSTSIPTNAQTLSISQLNKLQFFSKVVVDRTSPISRLRAKSALHELNNAYSHKFNLSRLHNNHQHPHNLNQTSNDKNTPTTSSSLAENAKYNHSPENSLGSHSINYTTKRSSPPNLSSRIYQYSPSNDGSNSLSSRNNRHKQNGIVSTKSQTPKHPFNENERKNSYLTSSTPNTQARRSSSSTNDNHLPMINAADELKLKRRNMNELRHLKDERVISAFIVNLRSPYQSASSATYRDESRGEQSPTTPFVPFSDGIHDSSSYQIKSSKDSICHYEKFLHLNYKRIGAAANLSQLSFDTNLRSYIKESESIREKEAAWVSSPTRNLSFDQHEDLSMLVKKERSVSNSGNAESGRTVKIEEKQSLRDKPSQLNKSSRQDHGIRTSRQAYPYLDYPVYTEKIPRPLYSTQRELRKDKSPRFPAGAGDVPQSTLNWQLSLNSYEKHTKSISEKHKNEESTIEGVKSTQI